MLKKIFFVLCAYILLFGCTRFSSVVRPPSTPILLSITVTPTDASILTGETQQYTATGVYSSGPSKDVTSLVTWVSDSPGVATITSTGLATGVTAGTAHITATLGTIISSAVNLNVSVEPIVLPITLVRDNNQFPLISVTICKPNTNNCATIDKIILDTGSVGLRIFHTAALAPLNLALYQVNSQTIADCSIGVGIQFWGPLAIADVKYGATQQLLASNTLINLSDPTYSTTAAACGSDIAGPSSPFGGILGLFAELPNDCNTSSDMRTCGAKYSACTGTGPTAVCTALTPSFPAPVMGVPNPILTLPAPFNTGYSVYLPDIPLTGASALPGAELTLGLGIQTGNVPPLGADVLKMPTKITFDISPGTPFINNYDTGNFLNHIPSSIWSSATAPTIINSSVPSPGYCGVPFAFPILTTCPSTTLNLPSGPPSCSIVAGINNLGATLTGNDLAATKSITIPVGDGIPSINNWECGTGNYLFKTVAQDAVIPTYTFLGLPFFFGRTLYFGTYNQNTVIDGTTYTGPFVSVNEP